MKEAVSKWVAMIATRATRESKVQLCLARTSPEKREMVMGFEALRTRSPSWEGGSTFTHISASGFGLTHSRDRTRDAAVGAPALRQGDLYSFSFAIFGGGAGVVVGVADAGSDEAVAGSGAAWGLNLSHGALYCKKEGREKGELHSQQIVALPAVDRSPEHHINNLIEIEVEVDLTTKPYRLAFGLPDGPMVHALSATINCETIRPWCYLWGGADAIILRPRRRPRASRMEPPKHSIRPPLSFRLGEALGGLAATAAMRLQTASLIAQAAAATASPSSPRTLAILSPDAKPASRRHPRAVAREQMRKEAVGRKKAAVAAAATAAAAASFAATTGEP